MSPTAIANRAPDDPMRLSIAAWLLFTDVGVLLPRSEVSPKSPSTSNVSGCVEPTLAGSRVVKDDMHRLRPLAGRAGAWRPPSGGRPPQLRRVKMDAGSIHVVPGAATRRPRELEEVPMSIVGGLDIHRKQITFDYVDTETGEARRGQVCPADREHLAKWLARFAGQDAHFALEGCTGWRYVAEEIIAAGLTPHLADPAETAHLRGPKRRAKTDRADARHQRVLLEQGRLPECWIPPSHVLECRALLETAEGAAALQAAAARCSPAGQLQLAIAVQMLSVYDERLHQVRRQLLDQARHLRGAAE